MKQDYSPKYMAKTLVDRSNCFNAEYYAYTGEHDGFSLQFGGPGGKCDDD